MPSVAVSRLRVRAWYYLPVVLLQLVRTSMKERHAEASLSVEILREANRTFWTRSVWNTEASMQDFLQSKARRAVMRRLARWCDEASAAYWPQLSSAAPSWTDAHGQMQSRGRPSRVDHPSNDHLTYRIPAPDLGHARSMRFK